MSILSNIFRSLVNSTSPVSSVDTKKSPVVTITRYVRFRFIPTGSIDPNSGISFRITLDYNVGLIKYHAIICNGDNFSKVQAHKLLDESNRPVSTIQMNYNRMTGQFHIDPSKGTMGMILDHIYNPIGKHTPEDKLYLHALNKMHRNGFQLA